MSQNNSKIKYIFIIFIFGIFSYFYLLIQKDIYLLSIFVFGGFNNLFLLLRKENQFLAKKFKKLNFLNFVVSVPELLNKIIPSQNYFSSLFKRSFFPFIFAAFINLLYASETPPYTTILGSIIMEIIFLGYIQLRNRYNE